MKRIAQSNRRSVKPHKFTMKDCCYRQR